nr:MAG TPA_asm: zinc-ribbon domain protein [Caudoviricetes sp.]
MFCKNCGTKLPDDAKFCVNCGTKVDGAAAPVANPRIRELNGVKIDVVDLAIKYDALGRGRITATKYLMKKTGAGMKEATAFMGDLVKSDEIKELVAEEKAANQEQFDLESAEMEGLFCPKCHSRKIHIDKKGYSLAKGVIGAVVAGPLGLIAGKHKSNKVRYTCLNCSHQWTD